MPSWDGIQQCNVSVPHPLSKHEPSPAAPSSSAKKGSPAGPKYMGRAGEHILTAFPFLYRLGSNEHLESIWQNLVKNLKKQQQEKKKRAWRFGMEAFAIFNTWLLIEDKMSGGFPAARLWSGCPGLFEKLAHALLPGFWLSPYSLALWSNSLAFIRNNYRPHLTLCICTWKCGKFPNMEMGLVSCSCLAAL